MDADNTVVHVERVCCLECGTNYVKPTDGSTSHCNPGCPKCGYLGWISAVVPMTGQTSLATPLRPPRFAEDQRPTPAAKQH